ncbi:MAG: DUF3367 domain-containing protein [Actinobacteria bacterium]|uniref:Unannotated protein n=1 Tax=freshwater metagenome TaxID=449393 RepID=A0A6J7HRU2_9ZZZZ|nr:DUF3367 domain-containing protein [Actinomycetota bacterium]
MTMQPEPGYSTTTYADRPENSGVKSRVLARVRRSWLGLTLAFLAYVPLLLSSPGKISADTKAYLYLDPGRLLDRAWLMWNTNVNAGTVVHQNIGYMFPLGPYYWFMRFIGVPTWIAERLMFGTILFAAGYGAVWMLRRLGLRGPGVAVGGFVYMLSPYVLAYFGRTSVILQPWSALPWLIGLLFVALRQRTWRAPVLIAIIITIMSGTNASSVVFVLVAPALLVPYMVWVTHEVRLRDAARTVVRVGVATIPAQLWWVAGLGVQGTYGLPILQLTETVKTVAETSTGSELLRGLGYWYFYGRDGLSQWTGSSTLYTQNVLMFLIGFVLPTLGLLGAMLVRWRYRGYFLLLVIVGLIAGLGTYPYEDPTPFGSIVKETTKSAAGLALRNSSRALPLLVLGLAALLAAAVQPAAAAISSRVAQRRRHRVEPLLAGSLILVALLALPPLWSGGLVQADLQFPEELPEYWTEAASALDSTTDGSRVLELPGTDFYAYRWGLTQDPITPGIMDRPWVGRELTAYGTPPGVDLLRALDTPIQESVFQAGSVAPIARLFGASDVLLRMDTQYERYHAPRPADLWAQFGAEKGLPALGLAAPRTFGHPTPFMPDPRQPTVDEYELARSTTTALNPPLAVYPISDARSMVRAEPTAGSLIVWGDGAGLVNAAGAGLLDTRGAIIYSSTLDTHPTLLPFLRTGRPSLLITDTNRRQGSRWGTTRENTGATEAAGSVPLIVDPRDARLDTFPGTDESFKTVAEYGPDVANIRATRYGVDGAYSIGARPANAIDGDPRTSWIVGDSKEVVGDFLRVDYRHPISADHIDVTQLQGNRFITKLSVLLDGVVDTTVALDDSSFVAPGQRIQLDTLRTFSTLELRIDDANVTNLVSFSGVSDVGFREVTVPGVEATEWIRVPSAGLESFGTSSSPISFLFTRLRANPLEGYRQDPELHIARIFTSPRASGYLLQTTARVSGTAPSQRIDAFIGRPGTEQGYASVNGDLYLFGYLGARPSSALDGDPSTAWVTPFGPQIGSGFSIVNPSPTFIDHLRLSVIADGKHSVPTSLRLTAEDGSKHDVAVPAIEDSTEPGATVTVEIPIEGFTATKLDVTITGQRYVDTKDPFTARPHALPIAIAELGLPHTVGPVPAELPMTCRSGIMAIDGVDVPVQITGSTSDALARQPLRAVPCESSIFDLGAGDHTVRASNGLDTGIDIDQSSLQSVLPGTTAPTAAGPTAADTSALPLIENESTGRLSYRVTSTNGDSPYFLVLGQSLSDGWTARIRGGASLGAPILIDGLANGWLIDPTVVGSTVVIDLEWTPQKAVNFALLVSAFWLVLLTSAAVWMAFKRRRSALIEEDSSAPQPMPDSRAWPEGRRFGAIIAAVLTSGLLAALFGGFAVGAIVMVLSAASALRARGRLLLVAATLISMIGVVGLYVALQLRRQIPSGVEWVSGFMFAPQLTLIAVFCVVAESLLRLASRIRPNAQ